MSVRMSRQFFGRVKDKPIIRFSTEVHVDEYVEVDAEIDLEEFVKSLKAEDRAVLMKALASGADVPACDGGVHPQDAYYAFARGDLETVRKFVCESAGRIA
jgi:hypothetical protein